MSSTFAAMSDEGRRLLAFIHQHAPRDDGGLDGLAVRHNLRRQTPYEWASGKSRPNLRTLKPWAEALGVSRAAMVAAMDGDDLPIPPSPPDWAERLLAGVMALEEKGEVTDADVVRAQARALAHLAVARPKRPRRAGGGGQVGSTP